MPECFLILSKKGSSRKRGEKKVRKNIFDETGK